MSADSLPDRSAPAEDQRRWTLYAHHAMDPIVRVESGFHSLKWGEMVEVVPASERDRWRAAVNDGYAKTITDLTVEADRLRAENERLREDFENALRALEIIGRPGENYGLSDKLARSVALAAYIDLAPASDEQEATECFACHGTGKFEACADEDRPALTCAECGGRGSLASRDQGHSDGQ